MSSGAYAWGYLVAGFDDDDDEDVLLSKTADTISIPMIDTYDLYL
jgi:hypothetical protein